MRFVPLGLAGAYLIELEPRFDRRGFFARTFCTEEFGRAGLVTAVAQTSLSWNPRRGTLRGLHWQEAPHEEAKVVRCARGRIHDVLVDLRPGPTRLAHLAVELSADEGNAVYVPPGVAHGFLTLVDECEVHYQMSTPYAPASARGARYDDPAFGIAWPGPIEIVSERDLAWPAFPIGD